MKKAIWKGLAIAATMCMASGVMAQANPILTQIVDGGLPGGNPKGAEITNTGDAGADFSHDGTTWTGTYKLSYQSNGGAFSELTMTSNPGVLAPGASIFVQSEANGGVAGYSDATNGGAPGATTSSFLGNGNDGYAIRLVADDTVVDIYGEEAVDGAGTVWEYTDTHAFRNAGQTVARASYNATNFANDWTVQAPVGTFFDAPNNTPAFHQAIFAPGGTQPLGEFGPTNVRGWELY